MHHTISDSSNQHKSTSKSAPKLLPESQERVPTPMHRFPMSRNPQVDHQNIHQVAHDIPLSPQIITARHTSSVLKSLKTQSDKITSRGKLNSSQKSRGGRNIIRSNYNSKARDTSRSCQIKNTRERERSNT